MRPGIFQESQCNLCVVFFWDIDIYHPRAKLSERIVQLFREMGVVVLCNKLVEYSR